MTQKTQEGNGQDGNMIGIHEFWWMPESQIDTTPTRRLQAVIDLREMLGELPDYKMTLKLSRLGYHPRTFVPEMSAIVGTWTVKYRQCMCFVNPNRDDRYTYANIDDDLDDKAKMYLLLGNSPEDVGQVVGYPGMDKKELEDNWHLDVDALHSTYKTNVALSASKLMDESHDITLIAQAYDMSIHDLIQDVENL